MKRLKDFFAVIRIVRDYLINFFILNRNKIYNELNSEEKSTLYELNKRGFCIVEEFWSKDLCEKAILELERIISENPESLKESAKPDLRIFGANNLSKLVNRFCLSSTLLKIANVYNKKKTISAFTLGAKQPFTPKNKGSGGGWHRDSFLRQFKAILYLSDVGMNNGPFQLIEDSHKLKNIIIDTLRGHLGYNSRVKNSSISKFASPKRILSFPAKAGTLILVDTSSIHRGMPIRSNERYALTNYYFTEDEDIQKKMKKFEVVT